MIEKYAPTIFVGIITTFIFEIMKYSFLLCKSKVTEKNLPFSLNGYWISYHESMDKKDGELLSAFELASFVFDNGVVHMRLYQLTSYGGFYCYKGIGYVRGDKVSVSYCESDSPQSNHIGNFLLKASNKIEHEVAFVGNYLEFRGNGTKGRTFAYSMCPYKMSTIDRMGIYFLRKKYATKLMKREEFQDECRNKMQ